MEAHAGRMGEGYSTQHPVPTIQSYLGHQDAIEKESDAQRASAETTPAQAPPAVPPKDAQPEKTHDAPGPAAAGTGEPSQKQEMMDRMKKSGDKPTDKLEKMPKGAHKVKDPVTGLDAIIKNADFKDYPDVSKLDPQTADGPALQPATGGSSDKAADRAHAGNAYTSPAGEKFDPKHEAPNPAHPSNIGLQPFPPPAPISLKQVMRMLDMLQVALFVTPLGLWCLLAFRRGWLNFFFISTLMPTISFVLTTLASLAQRKIEKEVERVRFDLHAQRGMMYSPPTPESTEWLNAFIGTFWRLIPPDMFVPIADTIEDVMQQSLPKFVEAVRISDLGQGDNALRILSMRALPDRPGEPEYPRAEWIDQGTGDILKKEEEMRKEGKAADQAGDYVNYEVAFVYQAMPGQGDRLRAKNIHVLIEFFLGAFDWLHIPIPIWIQVEGIAGTVRLRIQFIPEAPFVGDLTFTFMGVPAVEVSAIPMIRQLPNILDLPLVSRFVKMAIAAGTASIVAPNSLTLSIKDLMSGAAIGDTRAVGVFLITIHHAEGLSAQDSNGKSDPYIVLAYAKFGKPLYSTRVILADLNPVYEETAALLLSQDEIKAEEELSAMLWDSDKHSNDDLIGRVHIPVTELIKNPNKVMHRTDHLVGFEEADKMKGTLSWSIGYFTKVPLSKELELPPEAPLPPPQKSAAEMEMRPGDKAPNPAAKDGPPPEPDVQRTPPNPKYKSGILSVIVHQVNNLERQNLDGASGDDREGRAGQDTDQANEQEGNLPSGYCEIVVNDDMVYKTRVKQYTTMPFFEAGTEVFVRDWEKCVVRVVVRDSRLREKDPILGIVTLPLKKVLAEASEVTRLYAIEEGVGWGRANISVLFKAIDAKLPPNQLGWDTGTVELFGPITIEPAGRTTEDWMEKTKRLVASTTDSTEVIPKSEAVLKSNSVSWTFDEKVRLPVYSRYASSLVFEVGGGGVSVTGGNSPDAVAVLWLQELEDDKEVDVRIPVVTGKDIKSLKQNVLNDQGKKTHAFEIVGYLTTRIKYDSGLDEDHESKSTSQARRHAFEAYDHIEGEGIIAERNAHAMDDGQIDRKEQKAIDQAHKRQLENRQRGIASFKPYRTLKWMKEGVKKRIVPRKSTGKREPTVQSEA
ncbi:hypothetical protein CALCODRAFT_516259 [Calocera cornea HHB12733]|uniref:C2 domain-containing protein n=1 Tax=Calocera cornea HHB12733 TaxID=1353952 RepID=A0A165HDV7_9BASI|nr:hypothetical protein CALCODRAFT_516259 [Calocera cornea HHB12733]